MDTTAAPPSRSSWVAVLALLLAPINFVVWLMMLDHSHDTGLFVLFSLLALLQFIGGVAGVVGGVRRTRGGQRQIGTIVMGAIALVGAPVGWGLGLLTAALSTGLGAGWGRPLRIRGRQLHPNLTQGSDWTHGQKPDARALDIATRRALEALWLHDAQKEHASVPAFSRVSWLLAAAGAPAELLLWAHRAAIEEIDHTRLAFALAAGYGSRSHTVEPMPDLLLGAWNERDDPRVTLAVESLADGCQLEDFNSDVAGECALGCEEPVTRAVLEQIAREERSHAELSWAIIVWLVEKHGEVVRAPLRNALRRLDQYRRPTAVATDKRALVERADARLLRAHGRLPDERWAALWKVRLSGTAQRLVLLLDGASATGLLARP